MEKYESQNDDGFYNPYAIGSHIQQSRTENPATIARVPKALYIHN